MKQSIALFLTFLFLLPVVILAQNMDEDQRKKHFNLEDEKVALYGYDPISYFSNKEPRKGTEELTYTYKGVTYRFASRDNLEAFKNNPEKYEPAYGGWCAYTMGAKGEKVEPDPENYKIFKGELHVFYNGLFSNARKKWNKDEKNLKNKADRNWKKIIGG